MSTSPLINEETFEIGCEHIGDHHHQWFQCTEQSCDIWHCMHDIIDQFGLDGDDDAEIKELGESDTKFKCVDHGFIDMKIGENKPLAQLDESSDNDDSEQYEQYEQYEPAAVPNKRKKKNRKDWTRKEESLFLKELEKHGRDWGKIAGNMENTRLHQVRSHAQLHFLRLLRDGKKLPSKVLESGKGYTLSGKPLNKYSSFAIKIFGSPENVPDCDGVISDEENAIKMKRKKTNKKNKKHKYKNKNKKNKNKPCSYSNRYSQNDYIHIASTDFDSLYLSKQSILSLQPSYLIDHKRMDGKWCGAQIKMINKDYIIIEYLQSKQTVMIKTDINNLQERFSTFKSISTRQNMKHKSKTFPVGYEGINVNGKQCKVIRTHDNNSAQLKVKYICGGDEFWIHPDDERNVKLVLRNVPSLEQFSNNNNNNSPQSQSQPKKRRREKVKVNNNVVVDIISSDEEIQLPVSPPKKRRKMNENERKRVKKEVKTNIKKVIKEERINLCDISDVDDGEINIKKQIDFAIGKDLHISYWTAEDIICWITEIENGKFKKYSQLLLNVFKREEICGSDLENITEVHLKGWGIKRFGDYVAIHGHIQKLIDMSYQY